MVIKHIPLFSLIIISFLSHNALCSDFFTFNTLSKLSVMNSYEQPLSDNEKKALQPGFPLEIINSKQTLGDQITDAIKCKNGDETYYLLRSENGTFISSQNVSFEKHTGCISLWDTVELTAAASLDGKTTVSLGKGSTVVRVFQKNGATYLYAPERNSYGWVKSTSIFRKAVKSEKPVAQITTSDIIESIKRRIESANEQYSSVFSFLNKHTNQQKSVPFWSIESDRSSITCKLKGSRQTISQMETSTSYIVKDIEQFLLSKPYKVKYTNFEIQITVSDN